MKRQTAFLTICVFALTAFTFAQKDKSQRPSQPASAECKLADGKSIKTDYSTPHVKDPKTGEVRKMLGGHEPYGQVWRTGANEATTFVTDTDLTVNGKDIPAGSYTIFTIPNADKWTLIINKKTVDHHRAHILEKLGMRNSAELTRYAIRRGLVEP